MTSRNFTIVAAAALAIGLVAVPAVGGDRNRKGERVKGQVIKVEQQEQTRNEGSETQLTIRTRKGKELRLNLGKGSCQGCVEVGDRVQARVRRNDGSGSSNQVQSMKVRRSGEMFSLQKNGNGGMARQQSRLGNGSGSGQKTGHQVRARVKDGSNCNDNGLRSGQGGVNAGGGSQSGGSRGGGGGGGGGRG